MTRFTIPAASVLKLLLPAVILTGCDRAPASAAAVLVTQNAAADTTVPSIPTARLRAAVRDATTRGFYEANRWKAVWSDAATIGLKHSLNDRAAHGLDHLVFLEDSGASASPAQREVAMTRAALRYAAALAQGVTNPSDLHAIYTLARPSVDLNKPLAQAIAAGKLESWFARLAPQDDAYARLSKAYLDARQDVGKVDRPAIAGGVIHIGDTDSRVDAIVEQLVGGEYLAVQPPATTPADNHPQPSDSAARAADAQRYTQRIADAVEHLQRDYGIAADGVTGPDTLEVLNLRPGDRARALAVALERLRWLSRSPPATRIDVNTAAARLSYYRDGKLADSRRVIVGQPGKETPQLLAPIFRLVANPTWTIPKSIQNGEMAGVSPGYLRRHNMVHRHGWIVQKAGPSNALGLVKFDMRDGQAIYLHDTSAPSLFDRSQRHLSHGCVRVDDALGFAQRIAEDEGVAAKWKRAHAGTVQKFITLPHEIPVRLLYQNVFVDRDGAVAFRTDPYGWNAPIAKALGFDKVSNARARAETVDIGP
ncbi:MAG: L,D-transpeptidase family protein [Sphingomonas sp.]